MASVNIDAKLVRSPFDELAEITAKTRAAEAAGELVDSGADEADRVARAKSAIPDAIELGNGCICCSIADELFTSVAELVSLGAMRGITCDDTKRPTRTQTHQHTRQRHGLVLLTSHKHTNTRTHTTTHKHTPAQKHTH